MVSMECVEWWSKETAGFDVQLECCGSFAAGWAAVLGAQKNRWHLRLERTKLEMRCTILMEGCEVM